MNFSDPVYLCTNCKKILTDVEDLLFVEDSMSRPFCSENCIEKFYSPVVNHYENLENKLRESLLLQDEPCLKYVGQSKYMERILKAPGELWKVTNELDEEIYSFISSFVDKKGERFYLVVLAMVFNRSPSYIYLATATQSKEFLKNFKIGEQIERPEEFLVPIEDVMEQEQTEKIEIPEETLQEIENKKSVWLARLLEERSPADIPIEKFPLYEDYLPLTLESADEIYRISDEGDDVYIYIKAHDKEGVSFYYFVICLKCDDPMGDDPSKQALLPIVAFPSLDGELYERYREGEPIVGKINN